MSESEAETLQQFMKNGCSGSSVTVGGQKYMFISYRDDVETAYVMFNSNF